jgi:hypothetical protein
MPSVIGNDFLHFGSLSDTDCQSAVREVFPLVFAAGKPRHFAHEVHFAFGAKEGLE